jgi:hypothetical protein
LTETDINPTYCIDCGTETAGGVRCKACHGAFLRLESLKATAQADRNLLADVDREKLNGGRLAARLGISRVRGVQKIRIAREREAKRVELGIA